MDSNNAVPSFVSLSDSRASEIHKTFFAAVTFENAGHFRDCNPTALRLRRLKNR